jgi:hypothetical protein
MNTVLADDDEAYSRARAEAIPRPDRKREVTLLGKKVLSLSIAQLRNPSCRYLFHMNEDPYRFHCGNRLIASMRNSINRKIMLVTIDATKIRRPLICL